MRNLVLSMLAKEPIHGYELKTAMEQALGRLWPPVNMGQIYVTLKRLERDGLVSSETVEQSDRPDKKVYELTSEGRDKLDSWFRIVKADVRVRGNFFLQLVAALTSPAGPDPITLIDRQRRELLRRVREVQLLADDPAGITELLAIEGTMLHLQAELHWLETCETHLAEREARKE